jgi:hypothetical protein
MSKIRTIIYFTFALMLLLFQSCKKQKAENGLVGKWLVNSAKTKTVLDETHPLVDSSCGDQIVFSGELNLDEGGDGYAKIYGTFCDSTYLLFDKVIEDLQIGTHHGDMDFSLGYRLHSYQGYFNNNIYFTCSSLNNKEVLDKSTNEIKFGINGIIDQSTGLLTEEYSLNLVLTRQ